MSLLISFLSGAQVKNVLKAKLQALIGISIAGAVRTNDLFFFIQKCFYNWISVNSMHDLC